MRQRTLCLAIALLSGVAIAGSGTKGAVSPAATASVGLLSKKALQGYDMKVWLSNQMVMGSAAWSPLAVPLGECSAGLGLQYPRGTCVEHLYVAVPCVGAIVNGVRRVTTGYNGADAPSWMVPPVGDTARNRIWHTSITAIGEPNQKGIDDDLDGKVDEDELDGTDNDGDWNALADDVGADGIPDSLESGCHGPFDVTTNPDPAFDDFTPSRPDSCHPDAAGDFPLMADKNVYTEKNGLPDHGEPHVDEDYGAVSRSDLYLGATDTLSGLIFGHVPLGVKIWQRSYAWPESSAADIVVNEYAIVNQSLSTWSDAFITMFTDMDIGPVDVPVYWQHNYAGFDPATRTAYADNPVDSGSTPLGLTLLGTSKALDSLELISWWFTPSDAPFADSLIYAWMSGQAFHGELIRPNQPEDSLLDVKSMLSVGPFEVPPGDTVRFSFAFVSGSSVESMLRTAGRAQRLYDHDYFIPPVVTIVDSGFSSSVELEWSPIDRSPFGPVSAYRVYYGTTPGVYTDSTTVVAPSAIISGLVPGELYHFAVSAVDDAGNLSARSDEITNAPRAVRGLATVPGQVTISLSWEQNTDLDLAGYNIYRSALPDTALVRLNPVPQPATAYVDSAVWGDRTYRYRVAAVDHDGFEGARSAAVRGHLLPPSPPNDFIAGCGATYIHLNWRANDEGDLAGYNVYRREGPAYLSGPYAKLNGTMVLGTDFIDSTVYLGLIYSYYVEAVDTTDAAAASSVLSTSTASRFRGVALAAGWIAEGDSLWTMYDGLLARYRRSIVSGLGTAWPDLSEYSTLIVAHERTSHGDWPITAYPLKIKAHLLGGGHLLVIGRRLTISSPPYWHDFLNDIFGVGPLTELDSIADFSGATGQLGYPGVTLDAAKSASSGGRLDSVERFAGIPTERIVYTYHADPANPLKEGSAVGIRAVDTSMHAYYFSFPLYDLDSSSAQSMIDKVLGEFGETVVDASDQLQPLPAVFSLHEAYPNPFNPAATIRYDLPLAGYVSLKIYDLLGRLRATLVEGRVEAGYHEVRWDASAEPSGVYFYALQAGTFRDVRKMMLIR